MIVGVGIIYAETDRNLVKEFGLASSLSGTIQIVPGEEDQLILPFAELVGGLEPVKPLRFGTGMALTLVAAAAATVLVVAPITRQIVARLVRKG